MKEFKVYIATNVLNNMSYIGSTNRSLRDRINSHYTLGRYNKKRNIKNTKFLYALIELDRDKFTWEILEYAENREDVVKLENYYINKFDTIYNGYNAAQACVCNNGIDRKDIQDNRIFNFINIKTNEHFTGTQSELISKYNLHQPSINTMCNKSTRKSHKNWSVIGKKNKIGKIHNISHLYNLDTAEEFNGTFIEFEEKYGVKLNNLIYGNCNTADNWCNYEDKNKFEKKVKKHKKIF